MQISKWKIPRCGERCGTSRAEQDRVWQPVGRSGTRVSHRRQPGAAPHRPVPGATAPGARTPVAGGTGSSGTVTATHRGQGQPPGLLPRPRAPALRPAQLITGTQLHYLKASLEHHRFASA